MTTRITLSILLTTWIILIVGETAAFYNARQSLLRLMDENIVAHARGALQSEKMLTLPPGDRYDIRLDEPSEADLRSVGKPSLTAMDFVTMPGRQRERRIVLRGVVTRDGKPTRATVTFFRQTQSFDGLLRYLALVLLLISLACGLTTAWLALKLSRSALRPLRETADVIAGIDEKNLGRRIDAEAMPIELVPMSKRLNEMLERLQNVFQQRKQFLADAAHELRTPTASLLTTLEVALRRPRDQAALTEAMQTGLADARRLRKLVEQLMEHARSEHLRGPDAMEQADVAAVLRECVEIVTPLAREKGVTIAQDIPPELPFVTQRDRLRSVALNLLSNAIEYNRSEGSVSIRCVRDNGTLKLTIKDTGSGIAAEQLPHVFEPFYRGGVGRGDDPSHLGLGLFLVRSHVAALSGQCDIDSRVGEGTTLQITLPEIDGVHHAAKLASTPLPASPAASTTVQS